MPFEKLYVIHGAGNDRIGLVGAITTPLAQAGGNIVDLRQDVLHGLFTIYLVVDFSKTNIDMERCRDLVAGIGQATSCELAVRAFAPVVRDPEKKNILLILVGEDRPGIAAKISATLSSYRINIEFSTMIAREDVFLMELLVDCRHATIPLANLEREIAAVMAELKIKTTIQSEDVFNKKKRLIVFWMTKSLMPPALIGTIARQTGISAAAMKKTFEKKEGRLFYDQVCALLENLPSQALETIAAAARPTQGSQELVQTLKIMGYRLAVVASASDVLVERVASLLGIGASHAYQYPVDGDSRRLTTDPEGECFHQFSQERFLAACVEREGLDPRDVTVIRDSETALPRLPGIRLEWDSQTILELYNSRVLSRDNVLGLLGCFGIPD